MPKKIIDPKSGAALNTATAVPTQPKRVPDTFACAQLGDSYIVYNNESGSEVARFGSFADALAEATRRTGIEAGRTQI